MPGLKKFNQPRFEAACKEKRLGSTQVKVFKALLNWEFWGTGCGWSWSTPKATTRLMEGLVAKGLAVNEAGKYFPVNGFYEE